MSEPIVEVRKCPLCGSIRIKKSGKYRTRKSYRQRYCCLDCARTFY